MLPALLLLLTLPVQTPTWPAIETEIPPTGGGDNDAAVVVGISTYHDLAPIAGAADNAAAWQQYLLRVRQVPPARVVTLKDKEATRERILASARMAAAAVKPGGTLWFIFIGHGAPAPTGVDGLLLGADTQPDVESLGARGVPQEDLLGLLGNGAQAETIAVFDACFSGNNADGGTALVKGLQATIPNRRPASARTTILASSDTFAGPLPGTDRPAFSYLLLGALRGWGDDDGDKAVGLDEAFAFTRSTMQAVMKTDARLPSRRGRLTSAVTMAARAARPDLPALVAGRCPTGQGWRDDRCVVVNDAPALAATSLPLMPAIARPGDVVPRDVNVAVAPLAVRGGGPDLAWLGGSFSDALIEDLARVPRLRVVERELLETVFDELKLSASTLVDEASAPALGRLLGARGFVFGAVSVLGPQAMVRIRLVNVERGEVIGTASVTARTDDLFGAQAAIAAKVASLLEVHASVAAVTDLERSAVGVEVHRLLAGARAAAAALPPPGVRAEGTDVAAARAAAVAARALIAAAPSLPQGHLVLAHARLAEGAVDDAVAALARVSADDPRRQLFEGVVRLARGDAVGAARALTTLVATRSNDGEAWYALGLARLALGDVGGAATAWLDALSTPTPLRGAHEQLAALSTSSLPQGPTRAALEAAAQLARGQRASASAFQARFADLYLVPAARASNAKGDDAVVEARAAVAARADAPVAHAVLARALEGTGRCVDARAHARLVRPSLTLGRCP